MALGIGLFLLAPSSAFATASTELVSVSSSGEHGNFASTVPSVSGDGRYVVFVSQATTLVPDKTSSQEDIFLRDRQTGKTTRISVGPGGEEADMGASSRRSRQTGATWRT